MQVTSRGRPDLNDVRTGQKSIKTELESPGSPRGLGHVEQQLDADPEAEVWLLTLGPLDPNNHREAKLLEVIEENRDDIESYVPLRHPLNLENRMTNVYLRRDIDFLFAPYSYDQL